MKKILIVFYSRTGTTKIVAEKLAQKLNCDIEEIIDLKKREGVMGYMKSGKDALKKVLTELKPIQKNPTDYDLVIIGTPVWAGTMSSAIRTYCEQNKDKFKAVSFFSTQGALKLQKVFSELEKVCGKKPIAYELFPTRFVRSGQFEPKLNTFISNHKDFLSAS